MDISIPDIQWWRQLSPQWKQAFAEVFFRHAGEPSPEELAQLQQVTALRFAGPAAPYPNMSVELTDLSGLSAFSHLQILVVIFHQVETVKELSLLPFLKALFLYNNRIRNLEGIEAIRELEQLYLQGNRIDSLQPVQALVKLRELYVQDNALTSLEGLTEAHADRLEAFFCKPNEHLKQKELLRVERELGIRCRG
ncbi:MAG: leucine-rich repeat domain-containing protein [Flavisolibacter sp.]